MPGICFKIIWKGESRWRYRLNRIGWELSEQGSGTQEGLLYDFSTSA